jgi:hypothetical protein
MIKSAATNTKMLNFVSIILAVLIFFIVSILYFGQINGLNFIGNNLGIKNFEPISTQINLTDILIGGTIYLKTSVDFAILIGILMAKYPGFKNRVAIENGTAFGNALGTMVVLAVWFFFKEVKWLLAAMVFVASLVLLELAKSSIEHIHDSENEGEKIPKFILNISKKIEIVLDFVLKFASPILSKILPNMKFSESKKLSFIGLIGASFTIPFILGLDDFAGYVTLFRTVNVFGFGLGVFLGHTILNIALFINPNFTTKLVKNPIISFLGTLAFIGLGVYGLFEVYHVLVGFFTNH